MTPRSIRRAAERKRMKLERKRQRSLALAAGLDEATLLSEPKIPENVERKRMKLERKKERDRVLAACDLSPGPLLDPSSSLESIDPEPISHARLLANRANAQQSTGPTSSQDRRSPA